MKQAIPCRLYIHSSCISLESLLETTQDLKTKYENAQNFCIGIEDYGDTLAVYFDRSETDLEYESRIREQARHDKKQEEKRKKKEEKELAMLKKLKEKYET